MRLKPAEARLLQAMAAGSTLKDHRDLEGRKAFRLHPLRGEAETIAPEIVHALTARGLIDSNKKFPAATYWLTPAGKALISDL